MSTIFSIGLGVGTQNAAGNWLEVYYPEPLINPGKNFKEVLATELQLEPGNRVIPLNDDQLGNLAKTLQNIEARQAALAKALIGSSRPAVLTVLEQDTELDSVPEAYLKLHLISHRLVRPHDINLAGIFAVLPNVAWTNEGAIDLNELPKRQFSARIQGTLLSVDCIDKFPKMTDYVVPAGVRIADTARVRLGAYIGEGTTIMHEGFVNFNAGTEGPNMIEGRVSAGVFIGAGSDLGGGCSTMGTLSGGGNIIISVGKDCLIGANAGIGIPLGDRCTVEAGLYITAGTKVVMLDENRAPVGECKARALAGKADILFRRNSLTGAIECLTNDAAVVLNEALHSNN